MRESLTVLPTCAMLDDEKRTYTAKRMPMMTEPQFNEVKHDTPTKESEIPSIFSDDDLYLFGQGKEYRIYEKMGAHVRTVNGVTGTNFATWAPNALTVSVMGDFNNWRRDANPMHLRHRELGVWECFVPGVQIGAQYKFAIYSRVNNYAVDNGSLRLC